jgi:hypothetical protein
MTLSLVTDESLAIIGSHRSRFYPRFGPSGHTSRRVTLPRLQHPCPRSSPSLERIYQARLDLSLFSSPPTLTYPLFYFRTRLDLALSALGIGNQLPVYPDTRCDGCRRRYRSPSHLVSGVSFPAFQREPSLRSSRLLSVPLRRNRQINLHLTYTFSRSIYCASSLEMFVGLPTKVS